MKLNTQQKQAVETTSGRILVLAGAGSGKTRVIVERAKTLIEKGVDPRQILGLTFTNKAAFEMRERLEKLLPSKTSSHVHFCTFHSFCMQILRKEIELLGYTKSFSLYDEREVDRLLKQLCKEVLGVDKSSELPSIEPTKTWIAKAQAQGDLPEKKDRRDAFSQDIFLRLKSTLRAYNALSFDTLITLTLELFDRHPEVLESYQQRYRYIMIDEYQDTNRAQFQLAEKLASKWKNLFVVGDDDQSIYGWRGAEVKNILHFQADLTIKLEQNYRSTPRILKAANSLIDHNESRHRKKLWSALDSGDLIELFHAPSDQIEAFSIVQRILKLKEEKNVPWKDIAVFFRSNSLSRQLEMALIQASWQKQGQWVRGIPYAVFGGLEFSQRSEIKDILAYLRVIANPLDQEALLRIINIPRRGISDAYLDKITQENRKQKIPLWNYLLQEKKPSVQAFVKLINEAKKRFQNPPFHKALLWLIETISYQKAIEEEVKSEKMRKFKWENVLECVNTLKEANDESLADFIANTLLNKQNSYGKNQRSGDAISLMTLHSAKGLEFPHCFIAGVEEGILPHERSCDKLGIEEERRLFYVGITRARKSLTLSMAKARTKMGKPVKSSPSRFLHEIPKELFHITHHKVF